MSGIRSTIPAAVDALVNVLTLALPEVQVVDGPPTDAEEPDLICVGFTGIPGEPSIENTLERSRLASQPDVEAYQITCLASSWQGANVSAKAVRDRAYELVGAVSDELARDQTLGRVVMRARLAQDAAVQDQTNQGAVCTVRFIVHVDAFASRA